MGAEIRVDVVVGIETEAPKLERDAPVALVVAVLRFGLAAPDLRIPYQHLLDGVEVFCPA